LALVDGTYIVKWKEIKGKKKLFSSQNEISRSFPFLTPLHHFQQLEKAVSALSSLCLSADLLLGFILQAAVITPYVSSNTKIPR
jgi:hypothetical protein